MMGSLGKIGFWMQMVSVATHETDPPPSARVTYHVVSTGRQTWETFDFKSLTHVVSFSVALLASRKEKHNTVHNTSYTGTIRWMGS